MTHRDDLTALRQMRAFSELVLEHSADRHLMRTILIIIRPTQEVVECLPD